MQEENRHEVLAYRLFRREHGIPLRALAKAGGVSVQYLSRVELGEAALTDACRETLLRAMRIVLRERRRGADNALRKLERTKTELFLYRRDAK